MRVKIKKIMLVGLMLALSPLAANAALIVTTPGDDSVLERILGFDAGSLGIVDMDFGGISFNDAFGTDAAPTGFLFAATDAEALGIITDIQALLNLYNSTAATDIMSVRDSVVGSVRPTTNYLNVAFAVTPTTQTHYQTTFTGGSWATPFSRPTASRDQFFLNFARMTASTTVPEPGTLALLGLGLAGMGLARRRKKA